MFKRCQKGLLLLLCLAPFMAQAEMGDFIWARAMVGANSAVSTKTALDNLGNVYLAGSFSGTVDFDPGAGEFKITSYDSTDIFIQKLDSEGQLLWVRRIGSASAEEIADVAVDSVGNVHATGHFRDRMDFDPGPGVHMLGVRGDADAFILKLDTDGNYVWARRMGNAGFDTGSEIAVDESGFVHVAGIFTGSADLNPGPGAFNLFSAGAYDVFVQKLDSDGNFVWARNVGGSELEDVAGIALDRFGNIYLTGSYRGAADFDPGPETFTLTGIGNLSVYVLKLTPSGEFAWAGSLGGDRDSSVEGSGIAVDRSGDVYSVGTFRDNVDFDPGVESFELETQQRVSHLYVHKLDTDGTFGWVRRVGSARPGLWGHGIAVDDKANVYTTGDYLSNRDFDPGPGVFILTGGSDNFSGFVQALDTDGQFLWAGKLSGRHCRGLDIAVNHAGALHTVGYFSGTVDFDPGESFSNLYGGEDLSGFVVKLSGPPDTPPNAVDIVPNITGPTSGSDVSYAVAFDEAVLNFNEAADVVISHNGTAHTGVHIGGGPLEYLVTVTGITGFGSFTLAVSTTSDVSDTTGNALESSVTSVAVTILEPNIEGEGEGLTEGATEGQSEGEVEGFSEGALEGSGEGQDEGVFEGLMEGTFEGLDEGVLDGETEGLEEGVFEGEVEGVAEGAVEGNFEGDAEGSVEGEGETEGDGEGEGGPATGCNAFGPGGGCNPSAPFSSFKDILGRLFIGTLTVMVLVLMAAGQKRF